MIKAVILAAGIGSRLESLTKDKPKSLIKVNGIPIIKYQIDAYLNAGINKIYVVLGYKSEILKKYIELNYSSKIKFIYNNKYAKTNNMYSLWLCNKFINKSQNVFISNADVVFDKSIITKMINVKQSVIACDNTQYNDESMKISINSESEIIDISKSISKKEAHACSIDLYSFDEKGIEVLMNEISNIIETDKNQWTELAIQKVLKEKKIKAIPIFLEKKERWFEIDNINDLISADSLFSNLKFSEKKNYIFDLDGTLYVGENLIDGSIELINLLNSKKINTYFVSNNSSKTKSEYVSKLKKMGFNVKKNQIILSTDITILSLKSMNFSSGYIIGNENFRNDLFHNDLFHNEIDPEFVLLAYDTELTYEKLKKASIFLNKGIPFFATHDDKFCPSENGPIPDVGSFISLFKTSNNVEPVIFGKPNKLILSELFNKSISTNECVIVGDRLTTDFQLAINCDIDFICVLTGETSRIDIENHNLSPKLIIKSVKDLYNFLI